jgi:Fe-S oxidoreductase/nitrate reductase gamma subunit
MIPSREIFFNIDAAGAIAIYLLMTLPAALLAYGLARRVRRWRMGQPEQRWGQRAQRILYLLRMTVLHGRIVRRKNLYGGIMHACLFGGFLTLLAGTTLVMIETDIAVPLFGAGFLNGGVYLGFKLAMNLGGLVLLAGIALALYRRLVLKPATQESSADDILILAWLAVLVVQGYTLQALRLALTQDPWAAWSFVSYPAALALRGIAPDMLLQMHQLTWWSHALVAFGFIGYAAFSKLVHPFTAMANVLLRRLKPRGELDAIENIETAETIGASKLEHFSWAQLMSVDACMHCGRCLEYCPTFNTGKALRPRDFVLSLAGYQADQGGVFSGVLGEGMNAGRFRHGRGADRQLIGGVVSKEEIWDCTTCGACMEQCPVHIEHVPMIVSLRRNLVTEQNSFPPEAQPVFNSLERLGNPYQSVPMERAAWTQKMDVPVPEMKDVAARGETVDYLFFVGCAGSFVSRNQKITVALARILQAAGLKFAILGKEESCTGDPARRLGHEFLAQQLAMKTIGRMNHYNIRKVVTSCAHCFNAIRNEYPQLGGNYDVIHHSQLIEELVASKKISLGEGAALKAGKLTYHDPCYLGRYNQVFNEPRSLLGRLPAASVVEMPRNRARSFCCGGGGGQAFMKEKGTARINVTRAQEAIATGAGVVVTACAFCVGMFEDGVGAADAPKKPRVLDLAELVADALEKQEE